MDESWTQTDVTADGTEGTVGLFGYQLTSSDKDACPTVWGDCYDEYYFYMNFVPFDDISTTQDAVFRIWFQIGDSTSDWHGVEYINTTASLTVDTDLTPVSSTNSNFASNQNFDNDSQFRGQIKI